MGSCSFLIKSYNQNLICISRKFEYWFQHLIMDFWKKRFFFKWFPSSSSFQWCNNRCHSCLRRKVMKKSYSSLFLADPVYIYIYTYMRYHKRESLWVFWVGCYWDLLGPTGLNVAQRDAQGHTPQTLWTNPRCFPREVTREGFARNWWLSRFIWSARRKLKRERR